MISSTSFIETQASDAQENITPAERLFGHDFHDYLLLQQTYKSFVLRHYHSLPYQERAICDHAIDGSLKILDAVNLKHLLQMARPQRILEVGSFLGFGTQWILQCTNDWHAHVTTVDPGTRHRIFDDTNKHLQSFTFGDAERLTCLEAFFAHKNVQASLLDYRANAPRYAENDASRLLMSVPMLSSPIDTFNFAFLDGDHSYQGVIESITLAMCMMPAGGLIVVGGALVHSEVARATRDLAKVHSSSQLTSTRKVSIMSSLGEKLHDLMKLHHHHRAERSLLFTDGLLVLRIAPQRSASLQMQPGDTISPSPPPPLHCPSGPGM
jgi:predicted O-methyltransferase YrrM